MTELVLASAQTKVLGSITTQGTTYEGNTIQWSEPFSASGSGQGTGYTVSAAETAAVRASNTAAIGALRGSLNKIIAEKSLLIYQGSTVLTETVSSTTVEVV